MSGYTEIITSQQCRSMTTGLDLKDLEENLEAVKKDCEYWTDWVAPNATREEAQGALDDLVPTVEYLTGWLNKYAEALEKSDLYETAKRVFALLTQEEYEAMLGGSSAPIEGLTTTAWPSSSAGERGRTAVMVTAAWGIADIWWACPGSCREGRPDLNEAELPELVKGIVSTLESLDEAHHSADRGAVLSLVEERANKKRASELIAFGKLQSLYFDMSQLKATCESILATSQPSPEVDPVVGTPSSSETSATGAEGQ